MLRMKIFRRDQILIAASTLQQRFRFSLACLCSGQLYKAQKVEGIGGKVSWFQDGIAVQLLKVEIGAAKDSIDEHLRCRFACQKRVHVLNTCALMHHGVASGE